MKLSELIHVMEQIAPPALAEPWDSIGLQIGSPDQPVETILLAVDVTKQVVEEAARKSVQALVAHHPVLFDRVTSLRPDRWPGRVVAPLVASGRALYVAHTNLDAAPRTNTSTALARELHLEPVRALLQSTEAGPNGELAGIGVVAETPPRPLDALVAEIRERLGVGAVQVADSGRDELLTIAVVAGSARGLLSDVMAAGVDCVVAGEIGHHTALEAAAGGVSSVEVGHFFSERPAIGRLAQVLREELGDRARVLTSGDRSGAFQPR